MSPQLSRALRGLGPAGLLLALALGALVGVLLRKL
jgi:hypothetical protein